VNPFSGGKTVTLTGAIMGLKNGTISALTTGTVCFYSDEDTTCSSTGGTDANGKIVLFIFYILGIYSFDVLASDRGGYYPAHLEFSADSYSTLTIAVIFL